MPIDTYDPCPCGSGKKFKFCCLAAAEEIERVNKYQETRQTQSSLQVLDKLLATKPDLAWSYITKSNLLLNEGEHAAARETLVPLLEKQPDHPFAIVLYAMAAFASVGYDKAKPAIYRAFQRCSSVYPEVVGSLAMGLAAWMFGRQKYMASRQYLTQAMRLVPHEDKQDIFLRLLEFDSNGDVPYPLRSVHQPAAYSPPESAAAELKEEVEKLVHRAEALVAIGCYQPAAETYRHLAERDPESAELWQNAGFCAAWDGNEAAAAEGLHRAARLHQDAEIAVECETLAQLLDMNQPQAQLPLKSFGYRVSSASRLLTLLDEQERTVRLPEVDERDGLPETIRYTVLDRPPLPNDPDLWPELDAIPCSIGQIGIVVQAGEEELNAYLSGLDDDSLREARELFDSCASEVIEAWEETGEDLRFATAREQAPLLFTWHFPEKIPVIRQSQLEERRWNQNVDEIWPHIPLAGLGGKTPNEAQGDAGLEIPLRAAIYVLDAFCDRNGHLIDLKAVCEKHQVAPPQPIETDPDLPLQTYSVMQLHRLKIPELSDEHLLYVLNRVLLIHHGGFLHDVLLEALNRPSCADKVDRDRAYNTLAGLARDRDDRDETYRWITAGQEHAKTQDQAFEKVVRWEIRELTFRAEDPSDPNLMPLVNRLVQKYAKKLPQFLDYITTLLEGYGIAPPANLAEIAEQDSGNFSSGGIWTPGEESPETGEKKIWLPGQS